MHRSPSLGRPHNDPQTASGHHAYADFHIPFVSREGDAVVLLEVSMDGRDENPIPVHESCILTGQVPTASNVACVHLVTVQHIQTEIGLENCEQNHEVM
jgi:hypothetical protein